IVAEKNKLMKINEGLKILLEIEAKRKEGVISLEDEIVVFAKAGSEKPLLAFGKVKDILERNFEDVPAVIIIPGLLHFTEKEFLKNFRICI
ncbi:MAG: diphthine synthase, partial [Candidatus Aenigmatarchaeota archaeon]